MPKGHDSSFCNCNFCRAKRGEQYGQDNPNKGGYKITDTTKYKIAARKRIPELRKEMIEKNKKRWSNPENKKKHIKKLIGNAYVLGKLKILLKWVDIKDAEAVCWERNIPKKQFRK